MKQLYFTLMFVLASSGFTFATNQLETRTNQAVFTSIPIYGSAFAYNQLIARMSRTNNAAVKLNLATNFVMQYPITIAQVRSVAQMFRYDNNRLEFAKRAYASCTTPQLYGQLRNSFTYQYTFNALMQFVMIQARYGYNNRPYPGYGTYPPNNNPWGNQGGQYYPNYPNGNYGNQGNYPPNYPNNYGDNQYFNQFLTILRKESFDSNRLKMATNYVNQRQLSAQQIKQIAKLFDFDSNRLQFAKDAYDNCYDQYNYFLLRDVFTFASNYNSLITYTNR